MTEARERAREVSGTRTDRPMPRPTVLVGTGLATVAVLGLAVLWPGAGSADESAVAQRLQQLERQRLEALVDADVGVIERLHADDFELVPPPGLALTRDEYVGLVASGDLDYRRFEPVSDIEVRVEGDSAVLWYRSSIDVEAAAQGRLAHETWHLYLYEERDGQWQVVREQATAVGGFPPSGAG